MPIYEYACESCGHRFDLLQRLSDPDPDACPACGRADVRRLISLSSFHLKGSGWYVTDYKGKNPTTAASPHATESAAGKKTDGTDKSRSASDRAAA
jgi:putative FmdB family regulatory protein